MSVITIGEVEWHDLKRQITVKKLGGCEHKRLQYIEHGELLLCLDCEKQVGAIWALKMFFTCYQREKEGREYERAELKKDAEALVIHRAALAVQTAWRKRNLVPTCPHCHQGIQPSDGFEKTGAVNPNYFETKAMILKPNLEMVGRPAGLED